MRCWLLIVLLLAGGVVVGCTSPAAGRVSMVSARAALKAGPAPARVARIVAELPAAPSLVGRRSRLLLAWAADLESQAAGLRASAEGLGGARAAGLTAADRAAGLAAGLRAAVAAGDGAALPALASDWAAACAELGRLIP